MRYHHLLAIAAALGQGVGVTVPAARPAMNSDFLACDDAALRASQN